MPDDLTPFASCPCERNNQGGKEGLVPDDLNGLFDRAHKLLPLFPDLVVSVRDDSMILEKVPPWIATWLGGQDNELEGRDLSELQNDLARVIEAVSREVARRGEKITDYCVEFRSPSDSEHAVMLYAAPLPDRPGKVMFRFHDVTDNVVKQKELVTSNAYHGLIGRARPMHEVFRKIAIYGPADAPVVVTGETGTGKEVTAKALHRTSRRRSGPFVAVNCSAISEDLFESELFGHDRGSFTGASRTHRGRFERASGGTLFLDEIGDMPLSAQTKLLRVLETKEIERVGGEHPIPVDVRIVAATNVSLEQAVGEGRFRSDLFHRLTVFRIHLPALREHIEDLPLLVTHFLSEVTKRYNRKPARLTPEALSLLAEYSWPGNIRELRNVIERVVVESPTAVIGRNAFREWAHERLQLARYTWPGSRVGGTVSPGLPGRRGPVAALPPAGSITTAGTGPAPAAETESVQGGISASFKKRRQFGEEEIRQAFWQAEGNLTEAARILGVHKATLYRKMKKLGLTRERLEEQR